MYEIGNKCKIGNVKMTEESDCESCGTLEPFDIQWSDGYTWWCLDCAVLDENFNIDESEMKELLSTQKFLKREYYEKKLTELN